MKYTYIEKMNGTMELSITHGDRNIGMVLDPSDAVHSEMIAKFEDPSELEKYVEYLASEPDRSLVIEEIMEL